MDIATALVLGGGLSVSWDAWRRYLSVKAEIVNTSAAALPEVLAKMQSVTDVLEAHDVRNAKALENFLSQILMIAKLSAEAKAEVERRALVAGLDKKR